MTKLFLSGARIVDPASRADAVGNVLIENGVIAEIGATSTGRCPLAAAISPGPK